VVGGMEGCIKCTGGPATGVPYTGTLLPVGTLTGCDALCCAG
jgi:hypothetical protein